MAITDWLSVYFHAEERGEADLAKYLMRKSLDELIDRFGKDDEGFMRVNAKAGIIQADGNPRRFYKLRDGRIVLVVFKSKKNGPG